MHCDGCHNPATWDPDGGTDRSLNEITAEMLGNKLTDGLTLSGGEPFLQSAQCAALASIAKENCLNVWTYTGYTFEELLIMAETNSDIYSLLKFTDVLVEGPFIIAQKSFSLKWRGSSNQRVIDIPKSLATGTAVDLEM